MPSLDTLIARIALSLWSSAKRVEKLPTVTEVQPWERAEIVPMYPSAYETQRDALLFPGGI